MNNPDPYQPPRSTITSSTPSEYDEIKLSSTQGRVGRVRYIGYSVGLGILFNLLAILLGAVAGFLGGNERIGGFVIGGAALVIVWFSVVFAIKRLHDFDASGWWVLLVFVPLVNLILYLVLLIMPGTQGENRFGNPTPPNTVGVIILATILPLFFILGIIAAIAIPAYVDYAERARQAETHQNQPAPEQ